jgi:hypothetical protein
MLAIRQGLANGNVFSEANTPHQSWQVTLIFNVMWNVYFNNGWAVDDFLNSNLWFSGPVNF